VFHVRVPTQFTRRDPRHNPSRLCVVPRSIPVFPLRFRSGQPHSPNPRRTLFAPGGRGASTSWVSAYDERVIVRHGEQVIDSIYLSHNPRKRGISETTRAGCTNCSCAERPREPCYVKQRERCISATPQQWRAVDREGVVTEGGGGATQPLCSTCIATPIFSKCSLFVLNNPEH
jgi:hypothetical protein